MFNWFRNNAEDYFTPHQKSVIVAAVKQAEKQTSGEVRVFIESKCISKLEYIGMFLIDESFYMLNTLTVCLKVF
jgi:hypothetical protein